MPYWRLHYHLVWATAQRLPLIGPDEETIIHESVRMTSARMGLICQAIGMVEDHVHVAVSIPPTVAVADAVGRLKGASSHLVNQRRQPTTGVEFSWQSEYGVVSLTDKALPIVIAYVTNQKQHHAESTLMRALERVEPPERTTTSRLQPASGFSPGL